MRKVCFVLLVALMLLPGCRYQVVEDATGVTVNAP